MGYTPVPDRLVEKYNATTALVYGIIHRYWSMNGKCFASHETLGERIGFSGRTVLNCIQVLIKDGYIENLTPQRSNTTNHYMILVDLVNKQCEKNSYRNGSSMKNFHTEPESSMKNFHTEPESSMKNFHTKEHDTTTIDTNTNIDLDSTTDKVCELSKNESSAPQNISSQNEQLETIDHLKLPKNAHLFVDGRFAIFHRATNDYINFSYADDSDDIADKRLHKSKFEQVIYRNGSNKRVMPSPPEDHLGEPPEVVKLYKVLIEVTEANAEEMTAKEHRDYWDKARAAATHERIPKDFSEFKIWYDSIECGWMDTSPQITLKVIKEKWQRFVNWRKNNGTANPATNQTRTKIPKGSVRRVITGATRQEY